MDGRLALRMRLCNWVPFEGNASMGLRTLLVTHFRVQWQKKRVMWLKTAAECRSGYRTNPAIRRKADGQEEELDE